MPPSMSYSLPRYSSLFVFIAASYGPTIMQLKLSRVCFDWRLIHSSEPDWAVHFKYPIPPQASRCFLSIPSFQTPPRYLVLSASSLTSLHWMMFPAMILYTTPSFSFLEISNWSYRYLGKTKFRYHKISRKWEVSSSVRSQLDPSEYPPNIRPETNFTPVQWVACCSLWIHPQY